MGVIRPRASRSRKRRPGVGGGGGGHRQVVGRGIPVGQERRCPGPCCGPSCDRFSSVKPGCPARFGFGEMLIPDYKSPIAYQIHVLISLFLCPSKLQEDRDPRGPVGTEQVLDEASRWIRGRLQAGQGCMILATPHAPAAAWAGRAREEASSLKLSGKNEVRGSRDKPEARRGDCSKA